MGVCGSSPPLHLLPFCLACGVPALPEGYVTDGFSSSSELSPFLVPSLFRYRSVSKYLGLREGLLFSDRLLPFAGSNHLLLGQNPRASGRLRTLRASGGHPTTVVKGSEKVRDGRTRYYSVTVHLMTRPQSFLLWGRGSPRVTDTSDPSSRVVEEGQWSVPSGAYKGEGGRGSGPDSSVTNERTSGSSGRTTTTVVTLGAVVQLPGTGVEELRRSVAGASEVWGTDEVGGTVTLPRRAPTCGPYTRRLSMGPRVIPVVTATRGPGD